jgi:hypothetical protein
MIDQFTNVMFVGCIYTFDEHLKSLVTVKSKSKTVPLHAVMTLGGREVQLLLILDLDTRWSEWSACHASAALCPGERTPGTHCTGGWVGLRAGLDTEARGKSFAPAGDRTPIARL